MERVLVIIVTYNGMQWIEKCLDSTRASVVPLDVFVIDNGSTDGTQDFIRKNYPEVILFQSEENLGFGKANNIGFQRALDCGFEYVYLLNQDAWIQANTIRILIDCHKRHPVFGVLSPFQLQANLKHLDKNFCYICGGCKELIDDFYFQNVQEIYPVPMVMAAHWLVSRECLEKVGGFSPIFPHYGEDDNYANRVWFHGYSVGIVPEAIAIHDRENRVESKEKKLYMEYISGLIMLSDIYKPKSFQFLRLAINTLKSILLYHSVIAIKNMIKILVNYRVIKKSKKMSFATHAFLT